MLGAARIRTLSGRTEPKSFIAAVDMLGIRAPVKIVRTHEARNALGHRLRWAGLAAGRWIAAAAEGLGIAHRRFALFGLTLAACACVRRDALVEVEIGLGNPSWPAWSFTAARIRQAPAAARTREGTVRHGRPVGLPIAGWRRRVPSAISHRPTVRFDFPAW